MIAVSDPFAPVAEAPKPVRARSPRKSGDQASKAPCAPVAKSRDAGMTKVSVYLPVAVAKKLDVAAVLRDQDKSDIVAALLARELGSITFYDRATRPTAEALTVGEIGTEATA
jgi:hypothetical protein